MNPLLESRVFYSPRGDSSASRLILGFRFSSVSSFLFSSLLTFGFENGKQERAS